MSVPTETITAGPFNGNDVTDEFDFEFRIINDTNITVYETDDEGAVSALVLDTDYSVSGIGDEEGGTVTRLAGPLPTGYTWYMRSNYPNTQTVNFDIDLDAELGITLWRREDNPIVLTENGVDRLVCEYDGTDGELAVEACQNFIQVPTGASS